MNYLSTNVSAPPIVARRDPCVPKQQLQLEPGLFESAVAAMLACLGCRNFVAYQTALDRPPESAGKKCSYLYHQAVSLVKYLYLIASIPSTFLASFPEVIIPCPTLAPPCVCRQPIA